MHAVRTLAALAFALACSNGFEPEDPELEHPLEVAAVPLTSSTVVCRIAGAITRCKSHSIRNAAELGGGSNAICAPIFNSICPTEPVVVAGGHSFVALSSGLNHTCGLVADGKAYCWGLGDALGSPPAELCPILDSYPNPTANVRCASVPTAVSGGLEFAVIAAGDYHTCALDTAGIAYCWGVNFGGELGTGRDHPCAGTQSRFGCSVVPVRVAGGHRFIAMSAAYGFTCALDASSRPWCWGAGYGAQTPDVCLLDTPCARTPVQLSGSIRFSTLGGERFTHSCALTDAGDTYCWSGGTPGPARVSGAPPFRSIAVGSTLACGLDAEGTAFCWELFDQGGGLPGPRRSGGGLTFKQLGTGARYMCGIAVDDQVYCWLDVEPRAPLTPEL
jgi:hypothetical protein